MNERDGFPADPGDDPRVARLLAAATAPARPAELAGEEAAVAAFRAAASVPVTDQRRGLAARLSAKVAIAVAALLAGGGVALAASTGNLPGQEPAKPPAPPTQRHVPGGGKLVPTDPRSPGQRSTPSGTPSNRSAKPTPSASSSGRGHDEKPPAQGRQDRGKNKGGNGNGNGKDRGRDKDAEHGKPGRPGQQPQGPAGSWHGPRRDDDAPRDRDKDRGDHHSGPREDRAQR